MNIFALIVGVNDYPTKPLSQCVNDAKEIDSYLESLNSDSVNVETLLLTDAKATKTQIKNGILNFLSQAGEDDIALFYYSGHGAQEDAGGRFSDEHDGMLECLVPFYEAVQTSGYLLADKELRYLFSKLPKDLHLVTVFDCCHSGDMTRSHNEEQDQVKRLTGSFHARNYSEFLFSDEVSEEDLKTKTPAENFPFKNHIHIAACSASQLSWENGSGGIFTRYLLKLLEATGNDLTYREIARWADISLKGITKKKQNPIINVQGEGKMTGDSKWLKLHEAGNTRQATIKKNNNTGWHLSIGELMGLKKGTPIKIEQNGTVAESKVVTVNLTDSIIEEPVVTSGKPLKEDGIYRATVNSATIYSKLSIHINDLDGEPADKTLIEELIETHENIDLTAAGEADFYVNIFNEMVYISRPGDMYRPLAMQINLLAKKVDIKDTLSRQLVRVLKWNHFHTLENPSTGFNTSPIKVELRIENTGENDWHDVTDKAFELEPRSERHPSVGLWLRGYQIRVTNITNQPLFVGALALGSDFSITSEHWQNEAIELGKNESKLFYAHKENSIAATVLDAYKEVYNWKEDFSYLKFIVSNSKNITNSLPEYLQLGLDHPLILENLKDFNRGMIALDELEPVVNRWGTLKTTIKLKNPEYNIVSGELADSWEEYSKAEEIAPFLEELYFRKIIKGLFVDSEILPNKTGETSKDLQGIKKGLGNAWSNMRRSRKFKRAIRDPKNADKPRIVAEGDSWFLYPILVKDILDYVAEVFPVRSLAAAGDTLQNYKESGQLLREVGSLKPDYVMISGGGNDVIGPGIKDILKKGVPPGSEPIEYLERNTFFQNMGELKEIYKFFIKELKLHPSVKQLIIHGYDYVPANHKEEFRKNGWVNRYMEAEGVEMQEADRHNLIVFLVDSFNKILIDVSNEDPFVTYIPLRGMVKELDHWFDEIHPNDVGFQPIANKFIDAVKAHEASLNA